MSNCPQPPISTVFAALFALGASSAFAQSVAPDNPIVVTATRVPTALDRIPARIDVITRQEMEDRNIVTTVEALARTPGLNVVQSGGAGTITSVFSRGANSKHTLALYDGIRLNDAAAPNGEYNFGQDTVGGLERIEVLRGPASSVYGSDAIGGVVNFIPRIGGDDGFEPYFEASLGSRETYRLSVGAAGTTGAVSYGVNAEHFETTGFNNAPSRFPDGLGENDASTFDAINGVVDLKLTDVATLRGLVRWRQAEADIDDAALDRTAHQISDEYFVWRVGPRFELLNDSLIVEVNGGQVLNEREDQNGVDLNNPFPGNTNAEGERTFANWRNTLSLDELGGLQDLVLSGGVEWQHETIDVVDPFNDPLSRGEDATGVYALGRATVLGQIDVSAALRRDDTDAFGDATTWNIGAVLNLGLARVFASTGTSFKTPTLSERFATGFFNVGNPDLEPEEGESWEIGVDLTPNIGGADLRFGATYFSSDITNLIEYNFAQLRNVNIGKAELDGYEAFVEFSPVDALTARIDYTYTDAINAVNDTRLLRRPPHTWSASLQFTPTEALAITLDYIRRGDRADILYGTTNPFGPGGGFLGSGQADGYSIANLAARYRLNTSLSIFASSHNLLDEDYEDPVAYQAAPRSFSIGLRGAF